MRTPPGRDVQVVRLIVTALLLIVVTETTPLDLKLADLFYDLALGFRWRENWWFAVFAHEWVKRAALAVALLMAIGTLWVWKWSPAYGEPRRWLVTMAALITIPGAVAGFKHFSDRYCPWDLDRYGGQARQTRLFEPVAASTLPGRCFPAGHATTGFTFCAFALLWRGRDPRRARGMMYLGLAAGLTLGWIQQMRGAHFLSHTLWSAWWSVAVVVVCDRWLLSSCTRAHVSKET